MLNPTECWYCRSPRARIVETHKHKNFEMMIFTRGTYEYEVRHKKYVARAGDVVIYPPGTTHTEQNPPNDPPEMYVFQFKWQHIPPNLPLQVHDRNGRIRVMAEWLRNFWDRQTGFWKYAREGYMFGFVAEIIRLTESPENELVTYMRNFIYEHIDKPLTLANLAKEAHLSRSRFALQYRLLSGVTPMDDVRQIRLDVASRLLLCSDIPLKEVAQRVGYQSHAAFTKAMQKNKGLSPSQLRGMQKPASS